MRCFYYISGGLMRSVRQKNSRLENVVFLTLYFIQINSVANKMASVICAIFPQVLGDKYPTTIIKFLKAKFTGKSLCQGCTTRAAYCGFLFILQLWGRSGHSSNTSTDNYLDETNPLNRLEGKNCAIFLCQIDLYCIYHFESYSIVLYIVLYIVLCIIFN